MQTRFIIPILAGLGLLCASQIALAGCGLDVNPGELDTNHNAELSRDEVKGTKLDPVFNQVDVDHNGVISQVEYAGRCGAIRQHTDAGWEKAAKDDTDQDKPEEDSVVTKKAKREGQRQSHHVDNRIDHETDKATDKAVDKALDSIFGD